jgi:hypothetical protein
MRTQERRRSPAWQFVAGELIGLTGPWVWAVLTDRLGQPRASITQPFAVIGAL